MSRLRPIPIYKIHLSEWMAALGARPTDVAAETGLSIGYISEIASGKKKSPSFNIMVDIARALGIPVGALLMPPPPRATIDATADLPPELLSRLRNRKS